MSLATLRKPIMTSKQKDSRVYNCISINSLKWSQKVSKLSQKWSKCLLMSQTLWTPKPYQSRKNNCLRLRWLSERSKDRWPAPMLQHRKRGKSSYRRRRACSARSRWSSSSRFSSFSQPFLSHCGTTAKTSNKSNENIQVRQVRLFLRIIILSFTN